MRLELVTTPAVAGRIELNELDDRKHYIGAEIGNCKARYMLRRNEYQTGRYRWADPNAFCSGNGMVKGDRATLVEAITGVLEGTSIVGGYPGTVVVFTTAKELFLWALGEENAR